MNQPDDDDEKQGAEWDDLYAKIVAVLAEYGVNDAYGKGDYLIVDDNYGWYRQHVEVQRLHIFHPEIVARLRGLLAKLPAWQITLQIDVPGREGVWPKMGLTIRKHEIIEVLRRDLLPEDFRTWTYPGGRPGIEYD